MSREYRLTYVHLFISVQRAQGLKGHNSENHFFISVVTGGLDCRSLCRFLPLIPGEWIAIFSDLDPSDLPGGGGAVRINLHSIFVSNV
jgi:hypothetical protein